jgi:hypothetical protein
MKKTKLKIEDYADRVKYGWIWKTSVLQTYNKTKINRLKRAFKEEGINPMVGLNAILDLYQRVQRLEKKK